MYRAGVRTTPRRRYQRTKEARLRRGKEPRGEETYCKPEEASLLVVQCTAEVQTLKQVHNRDVGRVESIGRVNKESTDFKKMRQIDV